MLYLIVILVGLLGLRFDFLFETIRDYRRYREKDDAKRIAAAVLYIFTSSAIIAVCLCLIVNLPTKCAKVLENTETFAIVKNEVGATYEITTLELNSSREIYKFLIQEDTAGVKEIYVEPWNLNIEKGSAEDYLTKVTKVYRTNWFVNILTLGLGNHIDEKYTLYV